MKAYTDYPIKELGDEPGKLAPIRECEVMSYDGNKYATIQIKTIIVAIKAGYLYTLPGRNREVPNVDLEEFTRQQESRKTRTKLRMNIAAALSTPIKKFE